MKGCAVGRDNSSRYSEAGIVTVSSAKASLPHWGQVQVWTSILPSCAASASTRSAARRHHTRKRMMWEYGPIERDSNARTGRRSVTSLYPVEHPSGASRWRAKASPPSCFVRPAGRCFPCGLECRLLDATVFPEEVGEDFRGDIVRLPALATLDQKGEPIGLSGPSNGSPSPPDCLDAYTIFDGGFSIGDGFEHACIQATLQAVHHVNANMNLK